VPKAALPSSLVRIRRVSEWPRLRAQMIERVDGAAPLRTVEINFRIRFIVHRLLNQRSRALESPIQMGDDHACCPSAWVTRT
jgi:hypothetical protein